MNSTLTKGLQVLDLLARSRKPLGVTEVAARLSLAKSDSYRLLQTLVAEGFVRQEPDSSYRASTRIWELGSAMLSNLDVRSIAKPFMEKLQDQTRETVALTMLDGEDLVYIHLLEGLEPVRAHVGPGDRARACCTSAGKAMLACLPASVGEEISKRLERRTPATVTDPAEFMADLAAIRKRGYAVNRGEWRESVFGVGVALVDAGGGVRGGISVSGPAARMLPKLKKYGEMARAAAQAINAELAFTP